MTQLHFSNNSQFGEYFHFVQHFFDEGHILRTISYASWIFFFANFLLKISLRNYNAKLDNIEIMDAKSLNFLLTKNCVGNRKPRTEKDISGPPNIILECELY